MNDICKLEQLLRSNALSRRNFLQASVALGWSAAATAAIASRAAAQAPSRGGRLRVGMAHGSTTDSLDPATYENGFMQGFGYSRNNCLTEIAPDGSLAPELAESFEASDDAKSWVFKLRQDVEFHHGKTVTGADVVASINHHRGDESKSAAKVILDAVTDLRAEDDRTVVFDLSEGNADFAYLMADYHLAILPADGDAIDWQSGVGAGGYVMESFEPGVRAFLTRHPNYWKEGRAHVDEVELLSIIDATARTNALSAGEVDVIDRVDLKTVHLLKRQSGIKVEETSGTQHYTFAMRCDTEPFMDNHVRLALKYGIDREEILQKVLRGYGVVGNDHPISRSNRYHADELEQRAYDPDRAKFHLKEAGLSELSVDLSVADAAFAGAVDAGVLYQQHAAAAGINLNVVREPNDGYWSNVWMKKPWSAVYWGGRPTEDWMFSTAYASGAAWNDSFWEHERFNQLLVEARSELNEAKRREMYVEMQRIVSDEGGVVVPMFANYVFATSDKIGHDEDMAANWDLDGLKFAERWWFV